MPDSVVDIYLSGFKYADAAIVIESSKAPSSPDITKAPAGLALS